MARRTYDELIADFADNTIGAITPETMRDYVDSVAREISAAGGSPSDMVMEAGIAQKIPLVFSVYSTGGNTVDLTNNRIVMGIAGVNDIGGAFEAVSDVDTQVLSIQLRVNGAVIPAGTTAYELVNNANLFTLHRDTKYLASANDYLEIWVIAEKACTLSSIEVALHVDLIPLLKPAV